jgi:hypothetical protein
MTGKRIVHGASTLTLVQESCNVAKGLAQNVQVGLFLLKTRKDALLHLCDRIRPSIPISETGSHHETAMALGSRKMTYPSGPEQGKDIDTGNNAYIEVVCMMKEGFPSGR